MSREERAGPPFYLPGSAADPGPAVVRVFQRALALICLFAWLSLLPQVTTLIGEHGLLPAREFFERARAQGLGAWQLPSLLWLGHSDSLLTSGCIAGALMALLAACGIAARVLLPCNAVLYLAYVVAGDTFMSFQWDNLLIEACLLSALLPANRHAPFAVLVLRVLLFKLYFESGIAKWQSQLGDWQDGSAMSFYYETAPLPTFLAWYAHHLPAAYHHVESWAALAMELVVPWCVFGPRAARLFACGYFSLFLVLDTATANYGFFTYLAGCLHLFLLNDGDIERVRQWLRLPAPGRNNTATAPPEARRHPAVRGLQGLALAAWLLASLNAAAIHFSHEADELPLCVAVYSALEPLRVANAYHLFSQITRERFEPEFQTQTAGQWVAHALHYKPGPTRRAPAFVAPHQPRVDFRLWFYGLSFQRGMPRFVSSILDHLCDDPRDVQSLFADRLPAHPDAARIVFHRYRFSSLEEHARSGAYWTREELGVTAPRPCK